MRTRKFLRQRLPDLANAFAKRVDGAGRMDALNDLAGALIPVSLGHAGMNSFVREDLDLALKERDENEDAVSILRFRELRSYGARKRPLMCLDGKPVPRDGKT